MTQAEKFAFFGAMAQVVPVVLLAVMLEVKGVIPRLTRDVPRRGRAATGLWLGTTLLLLWSALMICVAVLALPNSNPNAGSVWVVVVAVGVGVAYMLTDVLQPLTTRAFAETLVGLAWLSPSRISQRVAVRVLAFRGRRAVKQTAVSIRESYLASQETRRLLALLERELEVYRDCPEVWETERASTYEEACQVLAEARSDIERLDRVLDEHIVTRVLAAEYLDIASRQVLSEDALSYEKRVAELLQPPADGAHVPGRKGIDAARRDRQG